MITIYLIVSLWIPGYDPMPLEMSRPDGTKFKYRISAACVLENTPAEPA